MPNISFCFYGLPNISFLLLRFAKINPFSTGPLSVWKKRSFKGVINNYAWGSLNSFLSGKFRLFFSCRAQKRKKLFSVFSWIFSKSLRIFFFMRSDGCSGKISIISTIKVLYSILWQSLYFTILYTCTSPHPKVHRIPPVELHGASYILYITLYILYFP